MFKLGFKTKAVPVKKVIPSTETKSLVMLIERYLSDESELSEKQVKYKIQDAYLHNRITLTDYRYLLSQFR